MDERLKDIFQYLDEELSKAKSENEPYTGHGLQMTVFTLKKYLDSRNMPYER